MTFQRKLLLGFCLMFLPVLLVGAEAFRSNLQERRALEALGNGMARTRTYAELETAMFDQSEVIWRYLSGMDPTAKQEFQVYDDVVKYWQQRWEAELRPDEMALARGVEVVQGHIRATGDSIFRLYDAGKRNEAYVMAQTELKARLLPALTQVNRNVYRQLRESSVRGAYKRLEEILTAEGRALLFVVLLALAIGIVASWFISRSLARPLQQLSQAMADVGAGHLHPLVPGDAQDEFGRLARSFARMQESLGRAQAQMVQSEKLASIGEMAAAVAHGLKNPLASLRATAQLALRQKPDSPAARESLQAIIDEVDRLDRRITHLLSFSRPAPFRPVRDRIPQLVDGTLSGLGELLRERGVEPHLDIPPDLPDVQVDPMQFEQVLVEIVSNAVNAMGAGGRLYISARLEPGESSWAGVVLQVTDTGAGIPREVLPSVCEPFFTTRPEGTGLGLAIARRYVEQNGGRLEIESEPGHGTTVRIHLPATSEAPATAVTG